MLENLGLHFLNHHFEGLVTIATTESMEVKVEEI